MRKMKLADMTKQDLIVLEASLACDPVKNKRKLEKVRFAIRDKIVEEKKAAGTLHWRSEAGYTGRQTNRR
jgi:hypothetical protein